MSATYSTAIATHNLTSYGSPEQIFPSREPIREIWEKMQQGKITCYTVCSRYSSNIRAYASVWFKTDKYKQLVKTVLKGQIQDLTFPPAP